MEEVFLMEERQKPCEKVIILETKVEGLENKYNHLDKIPEMMAEINTTLRYQIENSERKDNFIEKQTETLKVISDNHTEALKDLSHNISEQSTAIKKLNDKIDKTDEKVESSIEQTEKKFEKLDCRVNEQKEAMNKRWSIHLADVFQKVFWIILGAVALKLTTCLFEILAK